MVTSPLIGFVVGMLFMGFLYVILLKARPIWVNRASASSSSSAPVTWASATA